jgi:hypothetical protein
MELIPELRSVMTGFVEKIDLTSSRGYCYSETYRLLSIEVCFTTDDLSHLRHLLRAKN